jgi:hypothetical protein
VYVSSPHGASVGRFLLILPITICGENLTRLVPTLSAA